jgi:hypothetical protein
MIKKILYILSAIAVLSGLLVFTGYPQTQIKEYNLGAVDDSYTKLLLHYDGTDTSTTFTDESGKTITPSGNAQIDTAYKKFGTGSGLFDGTGDYLSASDSADWAFGTGDFTIDFWYIQNSAVAYATWYTQRYDSNNTIIVHTGLNGVRPRFAVLSASDIIALYEATSDQTYTANTWYHLAFVRSGSSFYIFKDGASLSLTTTQAIGTSSMPDINAGINIADNTSDAYGALNGAIEEMRVSKGIARWTTNFTPPTSAYGAAASTATYTDDILILE